MCSKRDYSGKYFIFHVKMMVLRWMLILLTIRLFASTIQPLFVELTNMATVQCESLEARHFAKHGETKLAQEAEARHLQARGRVESADLKVNPCGKIDAAKLWKWNKDTNSVTVRIDDSHVPSFWAEIKIPLDQLNRFVTDCKQDNEDCGAR